MKTRRGGNQGLARVALVLAIALVVVIFWKSKAILSYPGTFLDVGEAPVKADAALVLAGGWTGERVLKGGEMVKQGYVPVAYLSSTARYYDVTECEAELTYGVKRGFEAKSFECIESGARSTREEAAAVIPVLRQRGVKRCLIVSVDTHLRRARRIFTGMAPDIEFHMVSAAAPQYKLAEWYKEREGRKAIFYEWTKVITDLVGM